MDAARDLLIDDDDVETGKSLREFLDEAPAHQRMQLVEIAEIHTMLFVLVFDGLHVDMGIPLFTLHQQAVGVDSGRDAETAHLLAKGIPSDNTEHGNMFHSHRDQILGNVACTPEHIPLGADRTGSEPGFYGDFGGGGLEQHVGIQAEITYDSDAGTTDIFQQTP